MRRSRLVSCVRDIEDVARTRLLRLQRQLHFGTRVGNHGVGSGKFAHYLGETSRSAHQFRRVSDSAEPSPRRSLLPGTAAGRRKPSPGIPWPRPHFHPRCHDPPGSSVTAPITKLSMLMTTIITKACLSSNILLRPSSHFEVVARCRYFHLSGEAGFLFLHSLLRVVRNDTHCRPLFLFVDDN